MQSKITNSESASDPFPNEDEFPEFIILPESIECKPEPSLDSTPDIDTAPSSRRSSCAFAQYQSELTLIKNFAQPGPNEIKQRSIKLGPKSHKYTLILDLDHTLVSSSLTRITESGKNGWALNIKVRPNALNLLKEMSELYEIIVFTAAEKDYAETVVNVLDPERKIIKKILSKEFCIPTKDGYFVKDLRIFEDRSLSDILIVDDIVFSYAFQIGNGIPVIPYEGEDEEDNDELVYLSNYLKEIHGVTENISEINKERIWGNIVQ